MNLQNLSDTNLLDQVKVLVGQEKRIVVQVIEYLKEIHERGLFLKMCYPSMFEFAMGELGYSRAEAHIRIQAAKLSQVLPEVSEKILNGELNLSVAACVQSEFRKEDLLRRNEGTKPLRIEEKKQILELVSNCSKKEAEEKISNQFARQTDEKTYQFTARKNLELKLEALFDEYAHLNFERDLGKLVTMLVDKELAKIEKKLSGPQRKAKAADTNQPDQALRAKPLRSIRAKARTYISIKTKREVWKRTEKMCTYVNPETGRKCRSKHGIEIDHIIPVSKGGTNDPSNLTILCDAHNRRKGTASPTPEQKPTREPTPTPLTVTLDDC